jgi:SAM-dependent methyltransferase
MTKAGDGFLCGICACRGASGNYEAREMMFGLRTRFHYAQCAGCGTLWLTDPPEDFAPYYPTEYYSFAGEDGGWRERVKNYLWAERDKTYFGKGGILGRFVARRRGDGTLLLVSKLKIRRNARILDVGCGSGKLLQRMAALGFSNLTGVDPFLSNEVNGPGLRIWKGRLENMAGEKYDLVMFHHSLEHVADPAEELRAAAGLLAAGGKCLVRLPVVAYAWEKYVTNWVQLDPPRHMWLPTERAMRILAESAGFRAEIVEYDSTEFQFWGSELYVRGVELRLASPLRLAREFGLAGLKRFGEQAAVLNRGCAGDQAAFLLEWAE